MKNGWLAAMVAAWCLLAGAPASAGVVVNPDFNTGILGWTKTGVEPDFISVEPGGVGPGSFLQIGGARGGAGAEQVISLASGETISFSANLLGTFGVRPFQVTACLDGECLVLYQALTGQDIVPPSAWEEFSFSPVTGDGNFILDVIVDGDGLDPTVGFDAFRVITPTTVATSGTASLLGLGVGIIGFITRHRRT